MFVFKEALNIKVYYFTSWQCDDRDFRRSGSLVNKTTEHHGERIGAFIRDVNGYIGVLAGCDDLIKYSPGREGCPRCEELYSTVIL